MTRPRAPALLVPLLVAAALAGAGAAGSGARAQPGADDGPAGPAAPDAPEPTPPVADVVDQWTEWDVAPARPDGQLLEDAATVRALFAPAMRTRVALTKSARDDLVLFAADLGYQLVRIDVQRPSPGAVRAVLLLEPRLRVRRVQVKVDKLTEISIQDELTRRMRLRPGEMLEIEDEPRAVQLNDEAERLREFLQDEGFFEASVRIDLARSKVYGADLTVRATLGPDYRVGIITIVNEKDLAIPGHELRRVFDHCLGRSIGLCLSRQRFSRGQHQADLQEIARMYQRRGYPAVRVQSDFDPRTSFDRQNRTVDFTLRIDERRRLAVVFEGKHGTPDDPIDTRLFTDAELAAQLTFDAASSADDLEVIGSALALQRHYQRKGWFDAAVSWERERTRIEDPRAPGSDRSLDRIVYRIDPGVRRQLRTVELAGHQAIREADLRAAIQTQPPPRSFRLLGGTVSATSEQLAADADRIRQLYRQRGYLDAQVTVHASPTVGALGDAATTAAALGARRGRGDLHVRFTIVEGRRTVIERIEIVFEGPHDATPEQVVEQLGLRPGEPFIASRIQDARTRLTGWYRQLGKPHADVSVAVTELDDDPHRLLLSCTVEERHEQRIGKIALRGNFRTEEWVIRQELGLREGQLLTIDALSRGLRQLRATGLFAAVSMKTLGDDDSRESVVNLMVEVEERRDVWAYVDLEGGYSTQRDFYVGLAPVWPNAWGRGLRGEIRGTASFRDILGAAGLIDDDPAGGSARYISIEALGHVPRWQLRRWLGISPDVNTSVFWRRQRTERFGELTTWGGSLAASRVWQRAPTATRDARSLAATLRYDFRRRSRQEDAVRLAGNNGNVSRANVFNRTGAVGLVLSWEQRVDERGNINPLSPARGFKLEGGVGLAHPYLLGQDAFVKVSGTGQWLRRLTPRLQLRVEGRYDQGFPLGGAVLLPEVERFFAGGDETVRGFAEDRLAVEVVETPVPPFTGITQVEVLPAGGNIRLLGSVDLQVSLWRVGGMPLASAVFVDAGAITNTLGALGPEDVRPSVGVALARLLTPFGGLSLEWAVPLRPRPVDPPLGRLHFLVALRY